MSSEEKKMYNGENNIFFSHINWQRKMVQCARIHQPFRRMNVHDSSVCIEYHDGWLWVLDFIDFPVCILRSTKIFARTKRMGKEGRVSVFCNTIKWNNFIKLLGHRPHFGWIHFPYSKRPTENWHKFVVFSLWRNTQRKTFYRIDLAT